MTSVCKVEGCEREVGKKSARGMCRPHYRKFMKYGDPLVSKLGRPLGVRFFEKVEKTGGCWEWRGRKNRHGYGVFAIGHIGKELAHRVSFMLKWGVLPELCVLHRCDNPSCVNPDHLFLGTQTDNNLDMWAKGRGVTRLGRKGKTTLRKELV